MSKISNFVFAILVMTNARGKNIGGRIVGGRPTTIEEHPYQVSVVHYDTHNCGGSIINAFHILTAAHCTNGYSVETLSVRAGSTMVDEDGQFIEVARVFQHPNFDNDTYDYDVSVLRLKNSLTFGPGVQPISLPPQSEDEIQGNIYATATGWGRLYKNGPTPTELQEVILPTLEQEDCRTVYGSSITTRMFCAGYPEGLKDTCQGDSGGPLVYDGVLLGVTSWGDGCGDSNSPGVYAKVSSLRDYIDQQISA